ncbi:unnamed protein product [Phytophthora lilii]|uniref:Unnamed protein product n=1 Tax=Phytophthora lilii TaxID=2077276 RepID=A0A9W6U2V4_9STRA|nr:unnamed protein product [Phytophthora lilii]
MELRAHGEEVPELNISKGGRLSSKKRQQQQREQQMKQEQFHHQQIQQQIHQPQHVQPPHPLTIQVPQSQPMPPQPQQQQQQASNPFGLPLKINVPTTMPKFSLRTPLGNSFPTPRSHEFSLLMGLPSPQIDNSQLPSVLAMTNASANATSSGQRTPGFDSSFLSSGPPSISRGSNSYLSLGLFPTPKLPDRTPGGSEDDLDAMISNYSKFMGPDTPMAYHPNGAGHFGASPLLENIGANVFDHNQNNQNNANNAPRMAAMAAAAAVHGGTQQRMKMDFLSPRGLAAHNFQSTGFPTSTSTSEGMSTGATPSGSSDYAAQFFADNKNDKARGPMKTSSVSAATTPTPKPTGVTAA